MIKQQMLDDRIAQINGIFVQSPEGDNMPGAAVNSQNGLDTYGITTEILLKNTVPLTLVYLQNQTL
jgi:hypothetical protein